jgi:hypothetical protein
MSRNLVAFSERNLLIPTVRTLGFTYELGILIGTPEFSFGFSLPVEPPLNAWQRAHFRQLRSLASIVKCRYRGNITLAYCRLYANLLPAVVHYLGTQPPDERWLKTAPGKKGDQKMKCRPALIFLALCLVSPLSRAQQSMSANAGLGPGNSFTLFITFEKPMPNLQSISCAFGHQGTLQPGQESFVQSLSCSNPPTKDDDTHYRIKVDIPEDIAAGDYKIAWLNVSAVGGALHQYQVPDLPNLAPVTIANPKHLEFSPIKKLEVKP